MLRNKLAIRYLVDGVLDRHPGHRHDAVLLELLRGELPTRRPAVCTSQMFTMREDAIGVDFEEGQCAIEICWLGSSTPPIIWYI